MPKIELYQEYKLIGGFESNQKINGIVFFVTVCPINPKTESDTFFREITSISRYAINKKYNSFDDEAALPDLEKMTFSKAKARIALGMYEKGNDYIQDITMDTLDLMIRAVNDETVQKTILSGLLYLRKNNPRDYKFQYLDPEGFCYLLGVEKSTFLFNVGVLEENGLIGIGPTKEFSPENGGIYITSYGISALSDANQLKISQDKEYLSNDTEHIFTKEYKYDVALSFAGEDRIIAEKIAARLKQNNVKVFYDNFEESELWGKNLYEHLTYVYGEAARFCVMILSKNYAVKSWTNHERQSAQARAFREQQEYILPIKLDETKIPGLLETVGYISYPDHSEGEIVELILRKLITK